MVTEYVGIDLHRRRSVIVRMDPAGEELSEVRIANDPGVFAAEVGRAGPEARVVLEATYGWYWAVDLLQGMGLDVHLAHPLGWRGGTDGVRTIISTPGISLISSGWVDSPNRGSHRRRRVN